MTLDQVIKLIEAGYTRDEIQAMAQPEEPKPEEPQQEEPKQEPKEMNEDLKAISAQLADIKKGLYAMNILNSKQPEKKSADDVLAAALGGKKGD